MLGLQDLLPRSLHGQAREVPVVRIRAPRSLEHLLGLVGLLQSLQRSRAQGIQSAASAARGGSMFFLCSVSWTSLLDS